MFRMSNNLPSQANNNTKKTPNKNTKKKLQIDKLHHTRPQHNQFIYVMIYEPVESQYVN